MTRAVERLEPWEIRPGIPWGCCDGPGCGHPWPPTRETQPWLFEAADRARAAVFEKAYTPTDAPTEPTPALEVRGDVPSVVAPTDDERAKAANDAYHAMVDEAEADGGTWWGFSHQRDAWEDGYQQGLTAGVVRRTVQGEPADAAVLAALSALMPDVDWSAKAMVDANPTWVADMRAALRAACVVSVQGEPEWEYGIEYAPGNEEFEGQDLATIERRVKYIRRQGGYYSTTVRAMRRRPAGDPETVQAPEGEEKP